MTAPLQMTNAITPAFEIIAKGFKDISKDILNSILISFIFSINKQKQELLDFYADIEKENDILLQTDLDSMYNSFILIQENAKTLYQLAEIYKDKSDIFMQFYKQADELYDIALTTSYNISTIESDLIHQNKLQYAS